MSAIAKPTLTTFPDVLQVQIFSFFKTNELTTACLVCTTFNRLASSDLIWQPRTKIKFAQKIAFVPKKKSATWKQQYLLFAKWATWTDRAATTGKIDYSLLGQVVANMQGIW